jgi:hypothetical protein
MQSQSLLGGSHFDPLGQVTMVTPIEALEDSVRALVFIINFSMSTGSGMTERGILSADNSLPFSKK